MNIGVLGGTFDPPHDAHLRIAERSIEQFTLDKVMLFRQSLAKTRCYFYLHRMK